MTTSTTTSAAGRMRAYRARKAYQKVQKTRKGRGLACPLCGALVVEGEATDLPRGRREHLLRFTCRCPAGTLLSHRRLAGVVRSSVTPTKSYGTYTREGVWTVRFTLPTTASHAS